MSQSNRQPANRPATESETTTPAPRKRLSKAFLLRLGAIGLFLGLGTFAVMHSVQGTNAPENPDEATTAAESTPPNANETDSSASSETNLAATNPASTPDSTGSAFPGLQPAAPPSNPANSFSFGDAKGTDPSQQDPATASNRLNILPAANGGTTGPPIKPGGNDFAANTNPASANPAGGSGGLSALLPALRQTPPPAGGDANPADENNDDDASRRAPFEPARTTGGFSPDNPPLAPVRPASSSGNNSGAFNTASDVDSNPANGITAGNTIRPMAPPDQSSRTEAPQTDDRNAGSFSGGPLANPSGMVPSSPPGRTDSGSFQPGTPTSARPQDQSAPRPFENPASSIQPPASRFGDTPGASPGIDRGMADNPGSGNSPVPARSIVDTPRTSTEPTANQPVDSAGSRPATLAAAPIRSSGAAPASSAAQPVPGDTRFEGVQIPALAVQKIAPAEVQVNREATFELVVRNTGRSPAENVQVHDYVPEGTRLIDSVPAPSFNDGGKVSWDLGTLNPGQQVSVKLKLLPQRPGNIGSVAHVTFGTQASARTVCTQPKLTIRHEAPSTVLIGQEVLLNIFVENQGNGAAENVVLQEDLPEGLEFHGGQRELEYPIGTLRPGETRNVQLRLRATQVGQVRNVLAAHGEGQLQANAIIDLRIVAPQLALAGDGPSRKFLNRPATHHFSIANQGSAPATNMQLVARLPRGLRFSSANNQGQYDPNHHAVVWRLAHLDPQKTGTVELTTVPVATGNHDIQVTASADLNQQQQTTQTLVVQQLSELFFDIDDSADAIEVGTGTTFRVRVVNQGQIPATNVDIQVEFASAMQPQSVEGAVRHEIRGQTVAVETIPVLAPGQEVSFVIRASASAPGEHRTVVSVRSDDREIAVSKEESTHVYSDR